MRDRQPVRGTCDPAFRSVGEAFAASFDDGETWTEVESYPDLDHGGNFGYDPGHRLLYTSNMRAGLWRGVMP